MIYRAAALSAAALWLTSATVAGADDESSTIPASSQTPAPAPAPADELVCYFEKPTGSHMRVKVCRTRAQIQAAAEAAKRVKDEALSRGHLQNASGG